MSISKADLDVINEKLKPLTMIESIVAKLALLEQSNNEISSKINTMEQKLDNRLKLAEERISKNENSIADIQQTQLDFATDVEDEIEAMQKATEVLVNGGTANIKPQELYEKICSAIGLFKNVSISMESLVSTHLAPAAPAKTYELKSKSAPVENAKTGAISKKPAKNDKVFLIKFPTIYHKEEFMQQYYKHAKDLKLSKIGIKSNDLIYIHHNLSTNRYKALRWALKLKKAGNFVDAVKIIGFGKILVRFKGHNKFTEVKTVENINTKIGSNSANNVLQDNHQFSGESSGNQNKQPLVHKPITPTEETHISDTPYSSANEEESQK